MKKEMNTGVIAQLELLALRGIEKRIDSIDKRLDDYGYRIEDLYDKVFNKNLPDILE